jgi:hypothetical protein
MKRLVILIAAALVTGCVTPPQTVQELREGVRNGAVLTKMEQGEVKRPFVETFKSVWANATKCLNVTITSTTPGNYGPVVESIRYRSNSKLTGKKTAEMVLQQDAQATGKMPEGGYYVMLADIEGVSPNKTNVTIYGSSIGYDNVYQSIFAWARGESKSCPKFPMGGAGKSFTYHKGGT